METIKDLLPNEHILNFYDAVDLLLPEWLPANLSLMIGAGDLDHDNMTNVQKFSTFDVFFCNAWDNNGSFRKNVEYLISVYPQEKVICVIDHNNDKHIELFIKLFRGCFSLIDGHLGHTPHLTLNNLQKLLTNGGRAMNIYEKAENMVEIDEMNYWFNYGYFKNEMPKILLTASMHKNGYGRICEGDTNIMHLKFLTKIQEVYDENGPITYDKSLDLFGMSLLDLQGLLYCLQFTHVIPMNMKGIYSYNQRIWSNKSILELVITKVEPDYGYEKIALCRDSALQGRAHLIINSIKDDIDNKLRFWSFAKYNTLMKHITSPKFEVACAHI